LRVLVGVINGVIETTNYITAVGVAVAHLDGLYMCVLGHDFSSKMLVERRNGIVICMIELLGEFTRLSMEGAGERRGDVAHFVATTEVWCRALEINQKPT